MTNMRFTLFRSIFIFTFFFSAGAVSAATYYVDATGGSNSNSGTATDQAWQTIAKVNGTTFSAGDTISFKRGETFAGAIVVGQSGTSGSPITYNAYGSGAKPIINASGSSHGFDIRTSKSYINVDSLDIRNATTNQVLIFSTVSNVNISNVDTTGGTAGFRIQGAGTFSDITFTDTTAMDYSGVSAVGYSLGSGTTYTNITFDGVSASSASGQSGMSIGSGTYNNIDIIDATFSDQGTNGINISTGTFNGLDITGGTFSGNGQYGIAFSGGTKNNVTITGVTANENGISGLIMTASGTTTFDTVNVSDSTFNDNVLNGVSLAGTVTTDDIIFDDVTASGNDSDGFNIHNTWADIIIENSTASDNGVNGLGADGDGFSFHETSAGTIRYSIARNNKKSAIAQVNDSVTDIYNNIFSHDTNGTIALVYLDGAGTHTVSNNVIYSAATTGHGIEVTGPTVTIKNNIVKGFATGIVRGSGTVTEDYNVVNGATAAYSGISQGSNSLTSDPLFANAGSLDFTLQETSPAIDAGTTISGLTTDYLGNTFYGIVDIGAYDYQPTKIVGTDSLYKDSDVVIYGNERFRNQAANAGGIIDFEASLSGSSKTDYLELGVTTWETSGTYEKEWTESSTVSGLTNVVHTIGDLEAGKYYNVFVDETLGSNITGANCTSGRCLANSQGAINFTYTGTYSSHTFAVLRDTDSAQVDVKEEGSGEKSSVKNKETIRSQKEKVKVSGSSSALADGSVQIWREGELWKTVTVDGEGFWKYTLKVANEKTRDFRIKLYDRFGTFLASKKFTVKVDTEDPEFTSFPFFGQRVIPGYTVVQWGATDNKGVKKYKIYFAGRIYHTSNPQFLIPAGTAKGLQEFLIKAYDKSGNTTAQAVSVWVQ